MHSAICHFGDNKDAHLAKKLLSANYGPSSVNVPVCNDENHIANREEQS